MTSLAAILHTCILGALHRTSAPTARQRGRSRRRNALPLELLEPRVLLTTFVSTDLSGSWSLTGRDADGTLTFDGAGAVTGDTVSDNTETFTIGGTSYTLNSDGTLELHLADELAADLFDGIGAMNSSKDLVVLTNQTLSPSSSDNSTNLLVLVQHVGTYSNADVAGSWNFVTSSARGTFTADALGHFSGTVLSVNNSGTATITSTILNTSSYSINASTGEMTVIVNTSDPQTINFSGFLNSSKDIMSLHGPADPSAGDDEDRSFSAVKRAGTYSNADFLGRYTVAGQHARGTIFADGAGHIIAGSTLDEEGSSSAITGSYSVTSAGVVSASIVSSSVEGTHTHAFTGGINVSKNVILSGRTTLTNQQLADGDDFHPLFIVQSSVEPTLQLLPTDALSSESGSPASNPASFTLTRFGSTVGSLTIDLTISGSATQDTDYTLSVGGTPLTNSVTIPNGASSVIILLAPIDDTDVEGTEVSTLTLGTGSGFSVAIASASAIIFDNDLTTFSDADLNGTWSLVSGSASGSIAFDGAGIITGGEAVDNSGSQEIDGSTYVVNSDGTLEIHITDNASSSLYDGVGAISSTRDLFATNAQTLPQTGGDDNAGLAVFLQHLGTFTKADMAGTWNFVDRGARGFFVANASGSITSGSVLQINDLQTSTQTRSILSSSTYSIDPDTGELHLTLNTSDPGTHTFDGFMNTSKDVMTLAHTPDPFAPDEDRSLILVKSRGTYTTADFFGSYFLAGANVTGNIVADGLGHILSSEVTGSEGDSVTITGTYTISSAGAVTTKIIAVTLDGTETLNFTGTLNASKNALLSARTSLNASQLADGEDFDPILFIRSLEQPVVSIVSAGTAAESGLKTATYTVSRFGSTLNPLVVHFTVSGSGTQDTDYTLTAGAATLTDTVTIPAGSSSITIKLTPIADALAESTESAIVTLDADAAYEVNSLKSNASVGILNFSSTVAASVSKAKASEFNGTASGMGQFTLTRSGGDLSLPLTVTFALTGTADATHYNVTTSGSLTFNGSTGTVTFAAGKNTALIPFTPINDQTADAPSLNVILTVTPDDDPASYFINSLKQSATVNIADAAPTVSVTAAKAIPAANGSVSRLGQFIVLRKGLDLTTTQDVVFSLSGSAVDLSNFTIVNSTSVNFDALSSTGTITLSPGQKSATLTVNPIDHAAANATSDALIFTLVADGGPSYFIDPLFSAAAGDITSTFAATVTKPNASELNGSTSGMGQFTITRKGGVLSRPVTVDFALGGTSSAFGVADINYHVLTSANVTFNATAGTGTAIFAAGVTSVNIPFNSINDFTINLPASQGGPDVHLAISQDSTHTFLIDPAKETADIIIADAASLISVTATKQASEINGTTSGMGTFTFVRKGGNLKAPLTVNFNLGGVAIEDGDYSTVSPHSVTFAANKTTATINIQPTDDVNVEGSESVQLVLQPDVTFTYFIDVAFSTPTLNIADDTRPIIFGPLTVIPGATVNTPLTITFADLVTATHAQVPSGAITFKITKVLKGTLQKDSVNVVPNTTTIASGEFLTWTTSSAGTIKAFNVIALNGTSPTATITISIAAT